MVFRDAAVVCSAHLLTDFFKDSVLGGGGQGRLCAGFAGFSSSISPLTQGEVRVFEGACTLPIPFDSIGLGC